MWPPPRRTRLLNALVFLYKRVLDKELADEINAIRAKWGRFVSFMQKTCLEDMAMCSSPLHWNASIPTQIVNWAGTDGAT